MLDDLKHSLRTLRRTPLSSLSAIGIPRGGHRRVGGGL